MLGCVRQGRSATRSPGPDAVAVAQCLRQPRDLIVEGAPTRRGSRRTPARPRRRPPRSRGLAGRPGVRRVPRWSPGRRVGTGRPRPARLRRASHRRGHRVIIVDARRVDDHWTRPLEVVVPAGVRQRAAGMLASAAAHPPGRRRSGLCSGLDGPCALGTALLRRVVGADAVVTGGGPRRDCRSGRPRVHCCCRCSCDPPSCSLFRVGSQPWPPLDFGHDRSRSRSRRSILPYWWSISVPSTHS